MTSSIDIQKKIFVKTLSIIYQSIRLLILIKLFYYKIFWTSRVEKKLKLKVLTMTSSVNTWKLIFFKIMIIIYQSKDILILINFNYWAFIGKWNEKKIQGFKHISLKSIFLRLEVLLIPKYILIQTKNVQKYYDKLCQWFENAKGQGK